MKCEDCGSTRAKLCQGDLHLCKQCKSNHFPVQDTTPAKMAALDNGKDDQQAHLGASGTTTLDDIQKTLLTLTTKMDKLSDMEKELNDVKKSITYVSNSFDEFKNQIQGLKNENNDLRQQLAKSTRELDDLQQYTRRNNLEITGIPHEEDEDTDNIVVKLAATLGVNISSSDIDISHRLPRKHNHQVRNQPSPAPIIVKFVRRSLRNYIYSARKHLRGVSTRDVGFQSNNRIYINENLTPANKQLFYQANQRRKEGNWKFIWTNNCKIFTRKNTGDPPICISTSSDLDRIL